MDGISCLLTISTKGSISLFTRGDGRRGRDISYLKYYVNFSQIPEQKLALKPGTAIRGELVIQKASELAQKERQTIAGIANQKTLDPQIFKTLKVDFVPYHVFEVGNIAQELQMLDKSNFNRVQARVVDVSENLLTALLREFREKSLYKLDGLVVHSLEKYRDAEQKYPDYAFKFKVEGAKAKSRVTHIKWKISKNGLVIPTIYF